MSSLFRARLTLTAIGIACAAHAGAAEPPVTEGSYMHSPGSWQVDLEVPSGTKEIFVSLGDGDFASTGYWTALTGEKIPKSLINISDVSQTFRVRIVSREGRTLGPFTFVFDRDKELVKTYKEGLEAGKSAWLDFREYPKGRWLIYFGYFTSKRCGIQEVRYSIDSDALDRVMRFPACNLKNPSEAAPRDFDDVVELKRKPGAVKVQVLYADGTKSDVVTLQP